MTQAWGVTRRSLANSIAQFLNSATRHSGRPSRTSSAPTPSPWQNADHGALSSAHRPCTGVFARELLPSFPGGSWWQYVCRTRAAAWGRWVWLCAIFLRRHNPGLGLETVPTRRPDAPVSLLTSQSAPPASCHLHARASPCSTGARVAAAVPKRTQTSVHCVVSAAAVRALHARLLLFGRQRSPPSFRRRLRKLGRSASSCGPMNTSLCLRPPPPS